MSNEIGESLGSGEVLRVTDMAILVSLESGDETWIPKSVFHETSEIDEDSEVGEEGEVFVAAWFAEKEG